MMRLISLFAVVLSLLPRAASFSPVRGHVLPSRAIHDHSSVASYAVTTTRLRSTDDKQAEIAALEERLRELKGDETTAEAPAIEAVPISPELSAEELEDSMELEGESDDSVMFSERWKEAKEGYMTKKDEDTMGGLAKVGAALAFVVFLGLFSQVPVGEESLQRYQDVKGNPSRIDLGDLNSQ